MPGKVIKVSAEVYRHLTALKRGREGYDACLRRQFGLPSRKGYPQSVRSYFVIDSPDMLIIRRSKSEARGDAIMLAVKKGKKFSRKHYPEKEKIIEVREVAS